MSSLLVSGNLGVRRERDLRVDVARGLALLIIFIDHNAFLDHQAYGWLTAFTLGRFSFIDAADVFFFISGYSSGLIYTDILLSNGFGACLKKALKRCLTLYVAELALFLFCSVLILSAPIHDSSAPWSAFHRLHDLPGETLRATVTLRNPPPFFGLLPIYIFFIGLTPIALLLRIHRPVTLIILSVACYWAAQSASGFNAFTYSDGFNPFAWQLVFLGGVLIGFRKSQNTGHSSRYTPAAVVMALAGLLLIAFVRLAPSEKIGAMLHMDVLRHLVPQSIPLIEKQTVEPLRLLNLTLWVIVVGAISPASRFFRNRIVRLPIACGQNSLLVFCTSIFLNYLTLIYAKGATGTKTRQLAWNLVGCGALITVAIAWKWVRSQTRHITALARTDLGFRPLLKRGFQHVAVLACTIWHAIQDRSGGGMDI